MINVDALPVHVYDALLKRGHKKEDVQAMTPEKIFEEFCEFHRLGDWANTFQTALDGIRAAQTSS